MRGHCRLRPSPSMLVAFAALMVALGGTSYAIAQLPANSVGSKQLKKNAVTAAKVKDRSLVAKDFKPASCRAVTRASPERGGPPVPSVRPVLQAPTVLRRSRASRFVWATRRPAPPSSSVSSKSSPSVAAASRKTRTPSSTSLALTPSTRSPSAGLHLPASPATGRPTSRPMSSVLLPDGPPAPMSGPACPAGSAMPAEARASAGSRPGRRRRLWPSGAAAPFFR